MEAGVFALSRLRIRQQMRAGRKSAKVLYGFLENPEHFLWTIVVGNTLVNFVVLGGLVVWYHDHLVGRPAMFAAVYGATVLGFYTWFDLLPKMLFRAYPNRLCMGAAPIFRVMHFVMLPLVGLMEKVSTILLLWTGGKVFKGHLFGNREELRQVMKESGQSLSSEELIMINRVLDLQSLTVRQIMTPLAEAHMMSGDTTVLEALQQHHETGHGRWPIWEERDGQRRIMGLVDLDQLIFRENLDSAKPIGGFIRPAMYLEEDMRLEVALRRMQARGEQLAIVLGRNRRETGTLAVEAILKTMFGEVQL